MELDELKKIWSESDEQVEGQFRINLDSLKKISLEKAKSLLWPLKLGSIIEIVINAMLLPPILRFVAHNSNELKFMLPGLVLALMIVLTIAWNIYSLVLIATINYQSPIVATQKKLLQFNYWNSFRQQKLLYLLYPLAQTSFLIMICKAIPGIDLYSYPKFLVLQFFISLILVPVIIWIVKLSPDKNMEATLRFLDGIKKFERED